MEKIGSQQIWSYFDTRQPARPAKNSAIRGGPGHNVATYFQLAMKVAELQFQNRDYVLLFRGQRKDHQTTKGNTMLKPSVFRLEGKKPPNSSVLQRRFELLQAAEDKLVELYDGAKLPG